MLPLQVSALALLVCFVWSNHMKYYWYKRSAVLWLHTDVRRWGSFKKPLPFHLVGWQTSNPYRFRWFGPPSTHLGRFFTSLIDIQCLSTWRYSHIVSFCPLVLMLSNVACLIRTIVGIVGGSVPVRASHLRLLSWSSSSPLLWLCYALLSIAMSVSRSHLVSGSNT